MELDDKTYARVQKLSKQGDKLVAKKKFDAAVDKYREALELLPEPATDWSAATWLFVAIGDARFQQRNYEKSVLSFMNATFCPSGIGNPFVHLRLGQCRLELGEPDAATDELMRAYMGGGKEIFSEDNPKYFKHIRKHI